MTDRKNIFALGITGASGSGKSYLAAKLAEKINDVVILSQDHYYKDRSHLTLAERNRINYDHPDAVDFDLMHYHLSCLKSGKAIQHPVYNFSIHSREYDTCKIEPADIIIIEGILIFCNEKIRDLLDYKVFVDTPLDICFIRRLQRDIAERGRTVDSVSNQYLETVRPMYLQYVKPTMQYADYVISGERKKDQGVDYIISDFGFRISNYPKPS